MQSSLLYKFKGKTEDEVMQRGVEHSTILVREGVKMPSALLGKIYKFYFSPIFHTFNTD
jgi:tRNA splicing ligase